MHNSEDRSEVLKYLMWDEILNAYQISALNNPHEYDVKLYVKDNDVGLIAFYKYAKALTFRGTYRALLKLIPLLKGYRRYSCYAILPHDVYLVRKFLKISSVANEELMIVNKDEFKPKINRKVCKLDCNNMSELMSHYSKAFSSINEMKFLLENGRVYASLTDNGEIASIAYVQDFANNVVMIGGVFTREVFRRRNYARSCLSYMIQELLNTYEVVGLVVEEHNNAAKRLYESLGFSFYSNFVYFEITN